jgi:NAD(P)-dependent dehydrogenase (short-subunit alcohol dehydrogenase family)
MIAPCPRPGRLARLPAAPSRRNHAQRAVTAGAASPTQQQRALITGANCGIGLETAKALAAQGMHVTLACRDPAKAAAAAAAVREAAGDTGATVDTLPLDLASLASVRSAVATTLDAGRPIDVLVNNAGIMALPTRATTADGFERQLGVNHLGHFAFTLGLLPLLTRPDRPARVIHVSSSAHQFARAGMSFDDLQSEQAYTPWGAYGESKLANVLFSAELARRAPPAVRLTSNALHPGVVKTELARHLVDPASAGFLQRAAMALTAPFLKTPAQGAATSIHLASSPEVEGVSGRYFVNCKPVSTSAAGYDVDAARRLWEVSAELTGAPAVPW